MACPAGALFQKSHFRATNGTTFYSIKDWIAGLTGATSIKAGKIWRDYQARSGDGASVVSNALSYRTTDGRILQMDFTNAEGLYKFASTLRVTEQRTALRAIKDFLAKAGYWLVSLTVVLYNKM